MADQEQFDDATRAVPAFDDAFNDAFDGAFDGMADATGPDLGTDATAPAVLPPDSDPTAGRLGGAGQGVPGTGFDPTAYLTPAGDPFADALAGEPPEQRSQTEEEVQPPAAMQPPERQQQRGVGPPPAQPGPVAPAPQQQRPPQRQPPPQGQPPPQRQPPPQGQQRPPQARQQTVPPRQPPPQRAPQQQQQQLQPPRGQQQRPLQQQPPLWAPQQPQGQQRPPRLQQQPAQGGQPRVTQQEQPVLRMRDLTDRPKLRRPVPDKPPGHRQRQRRVEPEEGGPRRFPLPPGGDEPPGRARQEPQRTYAPLRETGRRPWVAIIIFVAVLVGLVRGCSDSMPDHGKKGSAPAITSVSAEQQGVPGRP